MIYAVRLGPVAASTPPAFAYVAFLPAGEPELLEATTDPQGLVALRAALKGQPFTCEPALAEAAAKLGLASGPLPPALVTARAQIAYELAAGVQHGASRPDALAALLGAAAKLWAGRVWEVVASDEPLHVAFVAGRSLVKGEVALDASDPGAPRVVLCDERDALAGLEGLTGEARVAKLTASAGLTIELTAEPAWAAAILQEAFRLPRVPTPERRRGRRVAPVTTQDLVMGAALMRALVAFAERGDDGEAEAEVEAASLKVKARIGLVEHDAKALQALFPDMVLTPVTGDGGAAARPARAAAPPVARGDAARPPPAALDDAMSPEELAALLKGGEARPPPPANAPAATARVRPPEVVDDSVTPEELDAILGGGGPAAPVAEAPVAAAVPGAVDDGVSPEELEAILKGGAAVPSPRPGAEGPPPATAADAPASAAPADAPAAAEAAAPGAEEEYHWKPLHPALPDAPAPPSAPPPAAPSPAPAQSGTQAGWLARTWQALRGGRARPEAARGGARPRPVPAPRPSARPTSAPRRPPAPPPEPPPDPAGPFAPFARALHVEIPSDPPPIALAEADQASGLARQLVAAAAGREGFVSFPTVAFQIVELVHNPKVDAREVAGFISRDPGLAADVLAVANSAAFRGVSEAASVRDAVARLGLQEVGRIASAVSARALLVPAVPGAVPSTRLFSRAVAVATAASSAALRLRGARSDHVWLGGLLHDVGLALGASALAVTAAGAPARVAERALEEAHVEIGAAALGGWALPQYLVDVCARHHEPELSADAALVDLHLVRLASALARLAEPEVAARSAREIVQSARALRLDPHAVRALAAELKDAEKRAALLVR